ncbi:hypothetical protein [Streptomyces qinglanensis]|uniref:Integral membrane protein n=1 Tax=Streptomyces qinglanensis TaxID=943816 RepID=A0A1H9QSG9_9ACTN|nr:hypothetical protein [Streptomyces qinglanensis]SER63327.1 hypothetical protein SAMN05421870_10383 [Streptomyces qinglanensis]
MTVGWCSRALRAGVFSALCVLVAALGHVLMSGNDVPAWALGSGLAVTAAGAWGLADRERGLKLVVTVAVVVQAVLHSAFSLAQSLSSPPSGPVPRGTQAVDVGAPHGGTGRLCGEQLVPHDGSPAAGTGHLHSGPMGHMDHSMSGTWSFGMLAAHLLAALLCGLWLGYGERAAFRLLRAVAGWLTAPLRLLLALPRTAERARLRAARSVADRTAQLLLLAFSITSRGPPAVTAAA